MKVRFGLGHHYRLGLDDIWKFQLGGNTQVRRYCGLENRLAFIVWAERSGYYGQVMLLNGAAQCGQLLHQFAFSGLGSGANRSDARQFLRRIEHRQEIVNFFGVRRRTLKIRFPGTGAASKRHINQKQNKGHMSDQRKRLKFSAWAIGSDVHTSQERPIASDGVQTGGGAQGSERIPPAHAQVLAMYQESWGTS